jgi:hypothetical protein
MYCENLVKRNIYVNNIEKLSQVDTLLTPINCIRSRLVIPRDVGTCRRWDTETLDPKLRHEIQHGNRWEIEVKQYATV